MPKSTAWGGGITSVYESGYPGNVVYRDNTGPVPAVAIAANGQRPIVIHSCAAASIVNGSPEIIYQGQPWAAGRLFANSTPGDGFRFQVRNTGGTMRVGRCEPDGGQLVDAGDGDTRPGSIPGSMSYSGAPVAPVNNSTVQAGPTSVSITYAAPTDNGGQAISGYRVQLATNAAFTTGVQTLDPAAGTLTAQFNGLVAGGTYYVRVAAKNSVTAAAGTTSAWSAARSVTLATAPSAPTLNSVTQASPTTATAAWTVPASNGGSAITGYRVQYATNAAFTAGVQTVDIGPATTRTITGTPGLQYFVRIAAKNAITEQGAALVWSATRSVVLVAEIGDLDGWSTYGVLPAGLTPLIGTGLRRGGMLTVPGAPVGLLREIQSSGSGAVVAGALGIERTMTGLKIGSTYRLDGKIVSLTDATPPGNVYRWAVVGIGAGATAATVDTATTVDLPSYTFVATATSHTIRIQLQEAAAWSGAGWFEYVGFHTIRLYEIPNVSPYRLQDTAYEGPLANHFSWACNTVGAAWWVDRENVTQFRQADSQDAVKATFSDRRGDGRLEYVDINASYATRELVNILAVTNHGRDAVSGNTDDVETAHQDAESVTAWGARVGQLDMTMRRAAVYDATNLFPNPSCEATSGTVTVRTNRHTNPNTTTLTGFSNANGATVSLNSGKVRAVTGTGASAGTSITAPAVANGETVTYSADVSVVTAGTYAITVQGATVSGGSATVNRAFAAGETFRMSVTTTHVAAGTPSFYVVRTLTTTNSTFDITNILIEASPIAEPYFAGSTAAAGDFAYAWTGTANASTSIMTAAGVGNTAGPQSIALGVSSTEWASSGARSLRVIPRGGGGANGFVTLAGFTPVVGVTYSVRGRIRIAAPLDAAGTAQGRRLEARTTGGSVIGTGTQAPNTAGVHDVTLTFTAQNTTDQIRFYHRGAAGAGDMWLDQVGIYEGDLTAWFSGNSNSTQDYLYSWTGAVNASTSVRAKTITAVRVEEVLEAHSTPEVTIAGLRWNAQEDPSLAARLDIQDRVRVEFRGVPQDCRIVGIKHTITPRRWLVDLALIPS